MHQTLLSLVVVLLLLCAGGADVALAGDTEDEMHAEAQKLLPQYFTKCGADDFTKETTFPIPKGAYIIVQYKGLAIKVQSEPLSQADALNGLAWKGLIIFTATAQRGFPHGDYYTRLKDIFHPDVWSDWRTPGTSVQEIGVEKRQGRIILIKTYMTKQLAAIPCGAVPQ